ncbi:MAG: DedA family protein [Aeromicrobium sp.]
MRLPSRGVLLGVLVAAILVLIVVILQVTTDGEAFGVADQTPIALSYLSVFLLIAGDAVIPILPGETVLNAASASAGGELLLPLIIIAGALGAIVGDSTLFALARLNRRRVQPQLEKARRNVRVMNALDYLGENRKVLLVFARYVPGLRFVVNATFGLSDLPYHKFLPWSAFGAILWSSSTCLLAYWVGSTVEDYPLASVIISGAITTALISVLFLRERRRRQKRDIGAESAD